MPDSIPGNTEPVHWSSYWARGCLTSLPQDFRDNYDGEVADFWQRQFATLPDTASILDVCTGNGAIALLAADYGRRYQCRFGITGVDAARIDPGVIRARHPALAGLVQEIEFISRCRYEQLDRPADSFDLIVSQYGIEYCDWQAAAVRTARLLRPGGRFAMINHAADSDMLATMREEHDDYRHLAGLRLLPALEGWLADRIEAIRLHEVVRETYQALEREYRRRPAPLYRYVLDMLEGLLRVSPDDYHHYRSRIRDFHGQVSAGYGRLTDMLRVNEAMIARPGWTEVFETAGLVPVAQGGLDYRRQHSVGHYHVFALPEG